MQLASRLSPVWRPSSSSGSRLDGSGPTRGLPSSPARRSRCSPRLAQAWAVATALVLGISILSWSWNALRGDAAQGAQKASALVSGTVFCSGGSLLALSALRELEQGRAWVLCLLAAAAANDAAAYFGGRRFGQHHLAPRVSPGKTWEGWWCGLVGSLAVAEAACLARLVQLSWTDAAVVAILASVFGPLGDLSKSLLKRARGVKTFGASHSGAWRRARPGGLGALHRSAGAPLRNPSPGLSARRRCWRLWPAYLPSGSRPGRMLRNLRSIRRWRLANPSAPRGTWR